LIMKNKKSMCFRHVRRADGATAASPYAEAIASSLSHVTATATDQSSIFPDCANTRDTDSSDRISPRRDAKKETNMSRKEEEEKSSASLHRPVRRSARRGIPIR
jgi:hypothetical protein